MRARCFFLPGVSYTWPSSIGERGHCYRCYAVGRCFFFRARGDSVSFMGLSRFIVVFCKRRGNFDDDALLMSVMPRRSYICVYIHFRTSLLGDGGSFTITDNV